LVHNEPEFEVEAVLKSRQLKGREQEYLVKWKGYHPIDASWVNESDMEHAQEAQVPWERVTTGSGQCEIWRLFLPFIIYVFCILFVVLSFFVTIDPLWSVW
jgi:hypothetical protein